MKEQIMAALSPKDIFDYYGIEQQKNKYLCPLHNDTHPSITVKGDLWRCWVCQDKSQNVVDFVMLHDGVGYADAIKKLCEIAGLEDAKNAPCIVNYKKELGFIEERINFCKNSLLFDFNHKESILKDLEKYESKKSDIMQALESDSTFMENELERVRISSDRKFDRNINEFERKRS